MKNYYVLFIKTGVEEKILQVLKMRLDSSLFFPFIPKREKVFKRGGKVFLESEICFFGYIFIESELSPDDFAVRIIPYIRMFDEIYRILSYSGKNDIALKEQEIISLKSLYGINYCIEKSVGFIEGEKIRVNSGPLVGKESMIKKINRHKREAIIEINFMGSLRYISVELEIIEKLKS